MPSTGDCKGSVRQQQQSPKEEKERERERGGNAPPLIQGARDEVAERLGFDGALLLHRVQVDPLPQLVPHGEGVASEAGQTKVGPFGRAENLVRARCDTGQ